MIELIGTYNTARVFATTVEDGAREQIQAICDTEAFATSKIRIMPDVHAGKGCTIGTTMTIVDKAVPNVVGVDIPAEEPECPDIVIENDGDETPEQIVDRLEKFFGLTD